MRSSGGLQVLLLARRHHYVSRLFLISHLRAGGLSTEAQQERAPLPDHFVSAPDVQEQRVKNVMFLSENILQF